jgi:vacuolar-type H+-ATPase subunit E/Vma4
MPKIRTKRARAHAPAAHLSKHTENNVQQKSNEPPKSAEHIIRDTLGSMNDDASQRPKQQLTKRAKREERRRRLMESK